MSVNKVKGGHGTQSGWLTLMKKCTEPLGDEALNICHIPHTATWCIAQVTSPLLSTDDNYANLISLDFLQLSYTLKGTSSRKIPNQCVACAIHRLILLFNRFSVGNPRFPGNLESDVLAAIQACSAKFLGIFINCWHGSILADRLWHNKTRWVTDPSHYAGMCPASVPIHE